MRWTLAASLVLLGLAVAARPAAAAANDASRARLSYEAMQRSLFDPRSGGYRETVGARPGVRAWPFSQALAATIAIAQLPRTRRVGERAVEQRLVRLEQRFRKGRVYAAWPGGDVYLDDNEWIAEDLLNWDALRGDPAARRWASDVFAAAVRAWDTDPTHVCPGGVYWTAGSANQDRNAVSTVNGAVVGLRLYALTHRASTLAWAKRMLAWVDRCLLAPNGLTGDHIRADGSIDQTQWSYNQGSLLGAYLLLYETTGDASALARAESIADAAVAAFAPRWTTGEPPEFAAIFFRRLLALAAVDGRTRYVAAARAYADWAWKTLRSSKTGLFATRGSPRLLDQAALVQLYAALARPRLTAGR